MNKPTGLGTVRAKKKRLRKFLELEQKNGGGPSDPIKIDSSEVSNKEEPALSSNKIRLLGDSVLANRDSTIDEMR